MGMIEIEQALELVRAHSGDAHFVGPREDRLLTTAETALRLRFPPTYRRFLQELGAGSIGSAEFYGIISDDFAHSGIPDAIWFTLTERDRSGLPQPLIVVNELGDGELFALDTSRVDNQGECPVVAWLPGESDPSENLEVVSNDFGTFFLGDVRRAIARIERRHADSERGGSS